MIGKVTKQIKPAAGLIAGGIAANFLNTKLAGTIGNDKIRAGAGLVGGILIGGMKGEMMKNIGAGMIAVSGMKLVGSFVPQLAGLTGIDGDVLNGVYDDVLNDGDLDGIDDLGGDDDMGGDDE